MEAAIDPEFLAMWPLVQDICDTRGLTERWIRASLVDDRVVVYVDDGGGEWQHVTSFPRRWLATPSRKGSDTGG